MEIRITVKVTVEHLDEDNKTFSESSYQDIYDGEDTCLERLATAFIYALPKHEFPPFDVLNFYKSGKILAHAERS